MIKKEIFDKLAEIYSKANLEKAMLPLAKKFYLLPQNKGYCKPEYEDILQRIVAKKAFTKLDAALISFSVFENETIFKAFLSTLSTALQKLIEKMLWSMSISHQEAEKFVGHEITFGNPHNYNTNEVNLQNEFYFFSVVNQQIYSYPRSNVFFLSLHPVFKTVLVEFYPKPKYYYLLPADEIPATDYCFSAEESIQLEMPGILAYYLQDAIKYSNKGRPADATLNKLQKATQLKEFFPGADEMVGKTRSMLVAGLLYNLKVNNISIDTVEVIKELFTRHYLKLSSPQFILMQLKGWGYLDSLDYAPGVEANFLEVLKQLPPGDKWVSTENLLEFITCRFIELKPINQYALNNRLYYDGEQNRYGNSLSKVYINYNASQLVNIPFIMGSIFLFAAFGLIEIAGNKIDQQAFPKTFSSAYDELKYIRLTSLGAYILGIADTYRPATGRQQNKLNFSEDSLMILAEGEMGVLEIMLANFAEKTGTNRFKVTHALFLKDCKSEKDISKKIDLFKRTIASSLPQYWEQQFKIWQQNAARIKEDVAIRVFKIPPEAKELQRLIAQDIELKALIYKAEQFYILVPSPQLTKFKSRLKELGYLVE